MTIINGMGGVTGLRYGARYTPVPNITPFTYRDGWTFLERIEHFIKWVNDEVIIKVNEIDEQLDEFIAGEFANVVGGLRRDVDINIAGIADLLTKYEAIINNSILAQDPVVAALMADPESETAQAASEVFPVKSGLPFVNIVDYGATLDGTSDDATAIDAAYAAVADGGRITAPTGSHIGTTGNTFTGKSVDVDFSGSTVYQLADAYAFNFAGVFTNDQAAFVNDRTHISVLDGSAFSPGDVVRVVSDDVIPATRQSANGPLMGMVTTVASVSGNVLTIREPIHSDDEFLTNVRVGKYDTSRVSLSVGEITTPPGEQENRYAAFVMFSGLVAPSVTNTRMTKSGGSGVGFKACYQPISTGCFFADFINDTSAGHNGYGIIDVGSTAGEYDASGHNVRHLFSDAPAGGTDTSLDTYGRSESARVSYRAVSGKSSTLDTHHGSRGHVFINPVTRGTTTAISLRGTYHSIIGGVISGASTGVRVFSESGTAGKSYGHYVTGLTMMDVGTAFAANEDSDRGASAIPTLTVDGGQYNFRTKAVKAVNSRVAFRGNPEFRSVSSTVDGGTGYPSVFQGYRGSFVGDLTVNLTSVSEGELSFIFQGGSSGSTTSLIIDAFIRMSSYARENLSNVVRVSNATVLANFRSASGFTNSDMARVIGQYAGGRHRFTWEEVGSGSMTRLYRLDTPTSGTLSFSIPNNDLTVRLDGSGTINTITSGLYSGQRLTLYALNNGSTVTVSGAGGNIIGATTISPGYSATLFWDSFNSSWRTGLING